jgi:hypothetical protein
VPTAGAVENLARLRDPQSGVSAGFVTGGNGVAPDAEALASLGTVFYEPLWVFCRGCLPARAPLADGQRMSIGPEERHAAWPCVSSPSTASSREDRAARAVSREAGEKLLRGEIARRRHPDLVGRARRAPVAGRA